MAFTQISDTFGRALQDCVKDYRQRTGAMGTPRRSFPVLVKNGGGGGGGLLGRLGAACNPGDSYAIVQILKGDGTYGGNQGALNSLALSGPSGSIVVCTTNIRTGSSAAQPYVLISVQQYQQQVVAGMTFDPGTGNLSQSCVPVFGTGLSVSPTTTVITQASDAGNDLQRDPVTLGAPSVSPSSFAYGQGGITLSCTIAAGGGGVASPTGYVTFMIGSVVVGTATVGSGSASTTVTGDAFPDTGSVTAYFNGDSSYAQASTGGGSYTLNPATPTISMSAALSSAPGTPVTNCNYGDLLTLTASVAMPSGYGGTAGGTVTFYDAGNALATATVVSGAATLMLLSSLTAADPSNPTSTAAYTRNLTATFNPSDTHQLNSATSAGYSVAVAKAVLNAQITAYAMPYGSAVPAMTWTWVGLLNGDTAAVLTGTYAINCVDTTVGGSTQVSPTTPVGTYTVKLSIGPTNGVDGSYIATDNPSLDGALTVTQATLTVTADSFTVPHGSTEPALTCAIVGILNSDAVTASVIDPGPNMAVAGSYVLVPTCTQPASNYAVTLLDGTLTVT